MKNILLFAVVLFSTSLYSQERGIELNKPNLDRGMNVMQSLSVRESARIFDSTPLSLQDVSDLLWAANGVNRPQNGKRTAPSAINAQDIDLYLFDNNGVYFYNAKDHRLDLILPQDSRSVISNQDKEPYPAVILLLVSDLSRFQRGDDSVKAVWAAMDAGIVSQNVLIFCASNNMAARPRAIMNKEKIKELIKLGDLQIPMLNIPVSYKK